jgi:hypothetical protein
VNSLLPVSIRGVATDRFPESLGVAVSTAKGSKLPVDEERTLDIFLNRIPHWSVR